MGANQQMFGKTHGIMDFKQKQMENQLFLTGHGSQNNFAMTPGKNFESSPTDERSGPL